LILLGLTLWSHPGTDGAPEEAPSELVNVALHGSLIESSRNPFGWHGLVDGVTESDLRPGCYATENDNKFPKFVTIDLGAPHEISKIVIHNSRNGNTKTVNLYTSLDGQKFAALWTHIFPRDKQYAFTHEFPPRKARYVKIEFADTHGGGLGGDYYMFLREVQVFGKPNPQTPTPGSPGTETPPLAPRPRSFRVFQRFALERRQPVTIVAFGDSLTEGAYLADPDQVYWRVLGRRLREAYGYDEILVLGAGLARDTTEEGRRRVETDVVAKQPDLVLINFGVYDRERLSPEEFRQNLSDILDVIATATAALVILIVPPPSPLASSASFKAPPAAYAQVVRELGGMSDTPIIDLDALLPPRLRAGPPLYQDHRLLNEAGHQLLADQLFALLGPL